MPYRVQLQNFEGPLDLLLFLIKKEEVDIYDIPIADITQQYLEYLKFIELLDLDHASEYVLMAATLIRIKAKMLLPRPEPEEGEDAEDPREELVQRLLEYQRYKEVAANLGDLQDIQHDYFRAGNFSFDMPEMEDEQQLGGDVTLFDLMSVFVDVLKRVPERTEHTVENIPVSVEEQSELILSTLKNKERVLFKELLEHIKEKIVLIVTFISILELVKNQRVKLNQSSPFSEIWISRSNGA